MYNAKPMTNAMTPNVNTQAHKPAKLVKSAVEVVVVVVRSTVLLFYYFAFARSRRFCTGPEG